MSCSNETGLQLGLQLLQNRVLCIAEKLLSVCIPSFMFIVLREPPPHRTRWNATKSVVKFQLVLFAVHRLVHTSVHRLVFCLSAVFYLLYAIL